jgi:hypothetical protein
MESAKLRVPKSLERALRHRNKRRLSRHTEPVKTTPGSNHESQPGLDEDAEPLPWRTVPRSRVRSGFDDTVVLSFEEIDGVEVIYEEQKGGRRVAKFAVRTLSGTMPDYSIIHPLYSASLREQLMEGTMIIHLKEQ